MESFFAIRRLGLLLASLVGLVVVCSVAIHPFGNLRRSGEKPVIADDLTTPLEVKALLERSCADCHSNQTVWPWYSYVAPSSWLVERDVRHGRDRMNLSNWSQYSLNQRQEFLADIATAVKNREMPLPQYTWMHHNAEMSDRDIDVLYQWARLERRKMKAASSASALSTQPIAGE